MILARVLLFAISIVLSSSGEDVGLHDTLDSNSLATPRRLGNPLPILLLTFLVAPFLLISFGVPAARRRRF